MAGRVFWKDPTQARVCEREVTSAPATDQDPLVARRVG